MSRAGTRLPVQQALLYEAATAGPRPVKILCACLWCRYKTLRKPSWTPPDWVFGPVWTALYTAMGYASYVVYKNGGGALPLSLYGVQLLMNLAWSPLFFRSHEIGFALLDITGDDLTAFVDCYSLSG